MNFWRETATDKTYRRYFRHAHFKGGSSQTTTKNVPAQSANEANLEKGLMSYNTTGLANSSNLLNQGINALAKTYNPEWENMAANYKTDINAYNDQYYKRSNDYLNDYQGTMADALGLYKTSSGNFLGDYQGDMAGVNDQYTSLANGFLPSIYSDNRQKALNADLASTVGSSISALGGRGILNSSITSSALNNISQNASNTLANNYSSDLQTASGLLGAKVNNAANYYNNRMNNANGLFNNTSSYSGNLFNNQMSELNGQYDRATQSQKNMFEASSGAQNASYAPTTSLFNYASQMATPAQNMYNTMYTGRMNSAGTTTSAKDGGASTWGAVGSIGSAAIACFVGNTHVRTAHGYKRIADINLGDEVYSLDDNDQLCIEKVLQILTPHMRPIVEANFEDGTLIETTESQRIYTSPWFEYVGKMKKPAFTFSRDKVRLLNSIETDKQDLVYDIVVSGRNIFFADGIAVEGYGD